MSDKDLIVKDLDDLIAHIYTRIEDIMLVLEEEELEPGIRWKQLKIALGHMKRFMAASAIQTELEAMETLQQILSLSESRQDETRCERDDLSQDHQENY